MRSIVEKTLQVRSDLTRGIRSYRRSVRTVRLGDPPPCLDRSGVVLAQWKRMNSALLSRIRKMSICPDVFRLIYLIGMH